MTTDRLEKPTIPLVMQFVDGLRSKNEDVRQRVAKELHKYVTTELLEFPQEDIINFLNNFNNEIYKMLMESNDVNDKKGAIVAILILIGVETGNTSTRYSKYVNYLRKATYNDLNLIELAAYASGKIAQQSSSTYGSSYVDFEIRQATEWITSAQERSELTRHHAVLSLIELAISAPTYFSSHICSVIDALFVPLRDPKAAIREAAVNALRAALSVVASKETKETKESPNPPWYKVCYDKAMKDVYDDAPYTSKEREQRENRIHGTLLTLNELFRCSNQVAEKIRQEIELDPSFSLIEPDRHTSLR